MIFKVLHPVQRAERRGFSGVVGAKRDPKSHGNGEGDRGGIFGSNLKFEVIVDSSLTLSTKFQFQL